MVRTTTPECEIGRAAPDFDLPGTDGRRHALASVRGPKGLVVMFICNHCPYVQAILPRLLEDARTLAGEGVASVAIMSNDPVDYPEDRWEEMVRIAQERDFPFPYLLDESQQVALAYGAVCTPDFFGFDADLHLQYRGRLDASNKAAAPADAPRELVEAMRLVIATGKGPANQYPSIGCSIKWRGA
ncbi:MAG: thioredoxin family protein [Zoogloeaceae bacterium]|nr:thioredoxin family protein [Zoogloeaceae bacterium]